MVPNVPVHVIQRGNNRHACFYQTKDYAVYLKKLKESAKRFTVKVHCFVLMTNHVHLLLTANDYTGISNVMQSLGSYYVRYINTTYQRTGTLWEGRFKSSLADSEEYLLNLYRYIEMNPVRAGMVRHPRDYPWSSYHTNGGDKQISLITPHPLFLSLGDTERQRKKYYNDLLLSPLSDNMVQQISTTTNKSRVLGSAKFIAQISQKLERRVGHMQHGGDRRSGEFLEKADINNKAD
jgi:putative transposase